MKKVLIIDDEADLCHLLKAYLQELNYEVFMAHNLVEAGDILNTISPDVMFIDNNLPDGFGWEKLDTFSQKFPLCKLNLISANHHVFPPGAYRENKNVSFIEKPLRLNILKKYL
jgi:two-component system, OmpR family, response regulator